MTDAIALAIIKEIGGWFATFVSMIGAIAGVWALIKSSKTTKAVEEQEVAVEKKVATLTKAANATKAIAKHTQRVVEEEREETRRQFHDIAQRTDIWMAQATAPTDSGRPPLVPLDDFADSELRNKK